MSDLTDALYFHLQCDLEGHLDAYQLNQLDTSASLWPDATDRQAACWYLGKSLFRKYNDKDRPSEAASAVALEKFLECNNANAAFDVRCEFEYQAELVQDVANEIYQFWYPNGQGPLTSSLNDVYRRGKLGKGSNRAARDVDLYTKIYDSPLSHTSDDLRFSWQALTASNPRSFIAEQMRSCRYGFRKVEGSSLSFVNKNVTTARSIATEPTINMWFQLGLAAILTDRLKSRYDISLDIQPEVNRAMARMGSQTGGFATVDLESASDLISLALCKRILPRDMLSYLKMFRSPTTALPSGEVVELHSMSTMGNGFTFPLMTAIFCAVISVVYRRLGIPLVFGDSTRRSFSVFGDDLVVKPEAARLLYKTLTLLGFRVNHAKSYVEGPFRESCGADFYNGSWCRGVYIKRLNTIQDYTVAINALNRWSARTGVDLPRLTGDLYRRARLLGPIHLGPPDEADDACVHVPLDMACGVKRMPHGIVLYKRWLSKARYIEIVDDDVGGDSVGACTVTLRGKGSSVTREYNPEGLHLAFLYGAIRNGRLSIQADGKATSYRTKPRVSASWDTLDPNKSGFGLTWRHWSGAVRSNLLSIGCVG